MLTSLCLATALLAAACGKTGHHKQPSPEAAKQLRLSWNLKTTVEAYKTAGNTDPKWDQQAQGALSEFARIRSQATESDEDWRNIISVNCAAAIDAGCSDPMIRYLALRNVNNQSDSKQEIANQYCRVAQDIDGTSYPAIRKYYAWHRAAQQLQPAYGSRSNYPPELQQVDVWGKSKTTLLDAISDRTIPAVETYEACHELLTEWKGHKDYYTQLHDDIRAKFPENWKSEPFLLLLEGECLIELGWLARGGGYASTVTPEGEKQFEKRLAEADETLSAAWELNTNEPRIAVGMMRVELGQGRGRDRLELWFKRAMTADPSNYDACNNKMLYIEPKWYGTVADMLAFGRECVQNPQWGGHVPLILRDAHVDIRNQFVGEQEKADYWKQPQVWTDLKSAFERFFELNPGETGWYHDYAWYAWQAGDWATVNKLVPKLGPVNYQFFGGEDKFNEMVAYAKAHAGEPKAKGKEF